MVKDVLVYTDYELIDRLLKDADSKWFGILYDRYASKVYNKCLGLIHDRDVAMDLTHDIFVKAFIHIGSFKRNSSFYTWLYTIVYNSCIDYLKKSNQYKTVNAGKEVLNTLAEEVEDEALLTIEYDRLQALLEKIPTEDKVVLMMKYQDKLSIQDISQVFGIGGSAVKMRINRAKKKILDLYRSTYKD